MGRGRREQPQVPFEETKMIIPRVQRASYFDTLSVPTASIFEFIMACMTLFFDRRVTEGRGLPCFSNNLFGRCCELQEEFKLRLSQL